MISQRRKSRLIRCIYAEALSEAVQNAYVIEFSARHFAGFFQNPYDIERAANAARMSLEKPPSPPQPPEAFSSGSDWGPHSEERGSWLSAWAEPEDAMTGPPEPLPTWGAVPVELDPFELRFTHASISCRFRAGMHLDDAIDAVRTRELDPATFPPIDAFELHDGEGPARLFSLSNRRLFVFRCLHMLGLLPGGVVRVLVHPWRSDTLQRSRYDERLGRVAPKWERSMSTINRGASVVVRSRYRALHFGHHLIGSTLRGWCNHRPLREEEKAQKENESERELKEARQARTLALAWYRAPGKRAFVEGQARIMARVTQLGCSGDDGIDVVL